VLRCGISPEEIEKPIEQPPFEATVRVGKGFRPIAQHGRLRVAEGVVTVSDSKGQTVATAPVEKVEAVRLSFPLAGIKLTVDGVKYNVDGAVASSRWRRLWFGAAGRMSATSKLASTFPGYLAIVKQP
jgi:hypothetical protein